MSKSMVPENDDRLLEGGRDNERVIQGHLDSPTWVVDEAWDKFARVCYSALNAYMNFCREEGLQHSYLLGLDILLTSEIGMVDGKRALVDIRPVILEGPCCNSYPACPNFFAGRLYKQLKKTAVDPDNMIKYPNHPTKVLDRLTVLFREVWQEKGHSGNPVVGVFTRPYPVSEEETAHVLVVEACRRAGLEVYRITPDEQPEVKDGKIWVAGKPVDVCYRRIERKHVPEFYGEELARKIIHETPDTIWINNWMIDDLRSKTLEEKVFRRWEAKSGEKISRPITLLGDEITPEAVRSLLDRGGFALKKFDSTGGKGVFLHISEEVAGTIYDALFERYDGRHMEVVPPSGIDQVLEQFSSFDEDSAIQQMRVIDARCLSDHRLVYDTRINVLYNVGKKEWEFVSGMSRVVPCGKHVTNGNTLLTNVSSGAEMAPLVFGHLKPGVDRSDIDFGPMMRQLLNGEDTWVPPKETSTAYSAG
ncbi:MAG: hypothetical protein QGH40_12235 [bacterium]|nr:hypothetical protein [bacterium]